MLSARAPWELHACRLVRNVNDTSDVVTCSVMSFPLAPTREVYRFDHETGALQAIADTFAALPWIAG